MKSRTLHAAALAATLALAAGCASQRTQPQVASTPGCLSEAQVDQLAADYAARRPAANPPEGFNAADAACTRARASCGAWPTALARWRATRRA